MADFQPNKSYKKFFRNSSFKDVAYKGGNISDFINDIGYSQVDTGSLVTTSSFNEFTSSYTTGSFTGSFNGTFEGNIENAVTASYALTAQTLLGPVESASYSSTSSYLNPLNQEVIVTGSVYVIDSLDTLGRSLIDENNIISVNWGTQELVDTNKNTSIDWENRLLYDAESTIVLDYNFKTFSGSVYGTSSWANNSLTASYLIGNVDSASYALTSSFSQGGNGVFSGSFTGSFTGSLIGTIGPISNITYRLTSSAYTASLTDYRIGVRYTQTGSVSIQLPLISTSGEIEYKFKDEEGNARRNNITLIASGSDLIDGDINAIMNRDYMALGLYNDGISNWFLE